MIINALLTMFYFLLKNVFLAPFLLQQDVSMTSGVGAAILTAGNYLANINDFFPVSTLLICVGVILSLVGGFVAWKLIRIVIGWIRGSG